MPTKTRIPRIENDNEKTIRAELRARGLTGVSWLESEGIATKHQKAFSDVLAGTITGDKTTKHCVVRALMQVMSDSFGVSWPWQPKLTPRELKDLTEKVALLKGNGISSKRSYNRTPEFAKTASEGETETLFFETRSSIFKTKKPFFRNLRKTSVFRGCVILKRCPVCFGPATYTSQKLGKAIVGKKPRTESQLVCCNGCYSGNIITSKNIMDVFKTHKIKK